MGYRIGVDIGGSFTDFAVFDEHTKTLKSLKVFSRPDEPGAEVIEGVRLLGERYGITPFEVSYFTHGTTVGINTVIQRKGLKLALLTTEFFHDVLEVARLKIPDMYNLLSTRPEPLISRDLVFGVIGRLRADGSEEVALDEASVRRAVEQAKAEGVEGIVVSLLHSYRNALHEKAVKAIIQQIAPEIPVFLSSETWPIIREYERTITSVIGAYVQPRVAHYLGSLQAALKNAGVTPEPRLTKSNGGVMTAEQGKRDCVQMILSGTASGVIGASYIAQVSGIKHCMSLDIGGTSADVAVVIDGQPQYGIGELIGEFQIFIPSVSVSSIGEGGGSIAWVDEQGVLKVGPESAGSRPGPACYGRGGTRATITDAFAALGLVGLSEIGYSAVTIDRKKARDAVCDLADKLGRTIEETAEAIIRIAVSGMYTDVSALVSRFGIDPRDFSCLAFGGAGPMMACYLARELNMRETVVPLTPGVLSALGGLIADIRNDFIKTIYTDLDSNATILIREEFEVLKQRALEWLSEEQGYRGDYELFYSAEMRYRGQSFELNTPLDPINIKEGNFASLANAFHAEHERVYGHSDLSLAVQIISLRLVISGRTAKPDFPRKALKSEAITPMSYAKVWLDGSERKVGVFKRSELKPGHHFPGPAVITQDDCTTVVLPGMSVSVDDYENLRIVSEIVL